MCKEPTSNKFDDLEEDWAIVLKFAARQLNGSRRPLKRSRTAQRVSPVIFLHCGGALKRSRTAQRVSQASQKVSHCSAARNRCNSAPFAYHSLKLSLASFQMHNESERRAHILL